MARSLDQRGAILRLVLTVGWRDLIYISSVEAGRAHVFLRREFIGAWLPGARAAHTGFHAETRQYPAEEDDPRDKKTGKNEGVSHGRIPNKVMCDHSCCSRPRQEFCILSPSKTVDHFSRNCFRSLS